MRSSRPSRFIVHIRGLKPVVLALIAVGLCIAMAAPVQAFCGLFVARSDGSLKNAASQVVIAHSGNRNVLMMANDFQGDVKTFARIVPIPVVPSRDQVSIGDAALMKKLNAFTAPRLAQYFDRPCQEEFKWYRIVGLLAIPVAVFLLVSWRLPQLNQLWIVVALLAMVSLALVVALPSLLNQVNQAGRTLVQSAPAVTIEDRFSVGEYDIAILSAEQSDELTTWLQQNQYSVDPQAAAMLQSYIDAGMKFFVVRVNLAEFQKTGGQFLRPIVLDYESEQFMLPIRLGTLNASGDQDLIIHLLSPDTYGGTENYETLAVPTDAESSANWPSGHEVPAFIQGEFEDFYEALFEHIHQQHQKAVFLEYATRTFGDNIKCDPCAVESDAIPTMEDLKAMGAWWSDESPETLITRLHVRYSSTTFPEDLQFEEIFPEELSQMPGITGRSFPQWAGVDFQTRYVIRRPLGNAVCVSKLRYQRVMAQTVGNLVELTGWDRGDIGQKIAAERQLNALDAQGQTALHRAVIEGNVARAESLIEQGANVNLVGNQTLGATPLISAIANNSPELTQLLLNNGANTNVSWRGQPLLLWAIGYSDLATVEQLLATGVSASTLEQVWDTAQQSGNADLIELLQPYVDAQP